MKCRDFSSRRKQGKITREQAPVSFYFKQSGWWKLVLFKFRILGDISRHDVQSDFLESALIPGARPLPSETQCAEAWRGFPLFDPTTGTGTPSSR
jgi:hypothetical protein